MIEIKRKEIYEKLSTEILQEILQEVVIKVAQAGAILETARQMSHSNDPYLKSCRQHLTDCRKFRTMIQSILIDRMTAEQTESPYAKKGEQDHE